MVLVIDPQTAGISGDMLLSSLVDLGADGDKIIAGLQNCEKFLPESTIKKLDFQKTKKHGIEATKLVLLIDETSDERKGSDIKNAINSSCKELQLSETATRFSNSCIDSLILAESKIHGESIDSVHFHEASSIDTLIDIVGTSMALDDLQLFDETVFSMPVNVGNGSISFSHGKVSNPAAAILEIFRNSKIKIHGSDVNDELTTPTGASLLVNLANEFQSFYPSMNIDRIGYGAGSKDFDGFSNVLKIVHGSQDSLLHDSVKILETNVDDVSGEILGNLIEKVMNSGAKDVSVYPGITKKGRPTNLVSVICSDENVDDILEALVLETGTLGIRIFSSERFILPRTTKTFNLTLDGKNFMVHYKISEFKGISNFKIEFDDLKKISNELNKSIKETEALLRNEISKLESK